MINKIFEYWVVIGWACASIFLILGVFILLAEMLYNGEFSYPTIREKYANYKKNFYWIWIGFGISLLVLVIGILITKVSIW